MVAAWNGHDEVVRLLLDKGADMEAKNNISYVIRHYPGTVKLDKYFYRVSEKSPYHRVSVLMVFYMVTVSLIGWVHGALLCCS